MFRISEAADYPLNRAFYVFRKCGQSMFDRLDNAGLVSHLVQPVLDGIQPARDVVGGSDEGFTEVGRFLPFQNGDQVAGMPVKRTGQRLQCARTSSPLRGVVLD